MSEQKESEGLPKRTHSVVIRAGGDTREDMLHAVRDVLESLSAGLPNTVCGAPSFGYSFQYEQDAEMTHDKYMEAVEALP